MNIQIINSPLNLDIYGYSATAANKDYSGTIFTLMDRMWQTLRSNNIQNKGQNIWVYEPDHRVFAGVELSGTPDQDRGLEQKRITLVKYAYYKHIGPYNLIQQSGRYMRDEIKRQGHETSLPYIEIYGHWTNDETKLETELLMALQ